jgi:polar amino acid transport system substrate-binding protein
MFAEMLRGASAVAILLAAVVFATVASGRTAAPAASCKGGGAALPTLEAGSLAVGTDNPAYPPWFGGKEKSPWKVSNPYSGQCFEAAVAYAVAGYLGFARSGVKWVYTPFNKSFAPGKKSFDFDINEISYTPARAKVVSFSASYYDVNQAVVVVKGTKIANVRTKAGLKPFKLGAQLGTTSYDFIKSKIKPSQSRQSSRRTPARYRRSRTSRSTG